MRDVTTDELLQQVNHDTRRVKREGRMAGLIVACLTLMVAGAILGLGLLGWWNQRKLDRQNLDAAVVILQYNLQQGKLLMPPQATPAAAPAPAATTPPAEAPPAKK